MSDIPPDSGVLSSGVMSPAVAAGVLSPLVDASRAKVADLEAIRGKLVTELAEANKVERELKLSDLLF